MPEDFGERGAALIDRCFDEGNHPAGVATPDEDPTEAILQALLRGLGRVSVPET